MPRSVKLYIQIDDNTPRSEAPFTNEPSTWDLTNDLMTSFGLDDWMYDVMKGKSPRLSFDPLVRGVPDHGRLSPLQRLEDEEDNIGWLTAEEFLSLMEEEKRSESIATKTLRMTLEVLSGLFGPDRIRVVFAVT